METLTNMKGYQASPVSLLNHRDWSHDGEANSGQSRQQSGAGHYIM